MLLCFKKYSLFALSLLCIMVSVSSFGQEPSYFTLGKKELSNTEVYSILQTKDDLVYIGTNRGLLVYKHGSFQAVPRAKQQNGSSLFGLKTDNNGELFCGNLSGQIFKLENGRLKLFYALEEGKTGTYLNYNFDDDNNLLIISGGTLISIKNNRTSTLLHPSKNGVQSLDKLLNGRIVIGTYTHDSVTYLSKGKIHQLKVTNTSSLNDFLPFTNQVLLLKGQFANFYCTGEIQLLLSDTFSNKVPAINNERYFQFSENIVWALDHAAGVRKLHFNKQGHFIADNSYFKDEFISAMTVGNNGTLFFGTFGHGIKVVSNPDIQHHINPENNQLFNGIAVDEKNTVFLTSRGGIVVKYVRKFETIASSPGTSLDRIFYADGIDFSVNSEYLNVLYGIPSLNKNMSDVGSVKDLYRVNSSSVLLATSIGVFNIGAPIEGKAWQPTDSPNISRISSIRNRCKAAVFDKKKNLLYTATLYDLIEINEENQRKRILYNNKRVLCQDLEFYNGELWCATIDQGILIFRDGKFIRKPNQSGGLEDSEIFKFEIKNDQLFIAHSSGFQILNLITNQWTTLGTAEGVINSSVTDFALSKDKLWLLSDGLPLSLKLNDLPQNTPNLGMYIDSVVASNIRVKQSDATTFSHEQNQFSFYVQFRGLEYESETTIKYRIKGFEDHWNSLPSVTNKIEYKYLPPGSYTFEVKANYRDASSEIKTYSFVINPPYWETIWFYSLIVIGLILILFLIYTYQIRRLQKRNKEKLEKQRIQANLFESELKALRSQMNPHFIFNSLNSIQDLILQQDTDASYDYIVMFADLVRNTLNYSNKDFIPIEKELEFLEVYLSLEKLRFGEDFNYTISFKGKQDVNVPSLIVQPFIENALVHGILHKSGKKDLTIEFEFTDKLTCTVTDNGIGRAHAEEIQKRQGNHHESFALDAINKRLSILQEQHGKKVGYIVNDLYDGATPAGTKVIITMPFKNQY